MYYCGNCDREVELYKKKCPFCGAKILSKVKYMHLKKMCVERKAKAKQERKCMSLLFFLSIVGSVVLSILSGLYSGGLYSYQQDVELVFLIGFIFCIFVALCGIFHSYKYVKITELTNIEEYTYLKRKSKLKLEPKSEQKVETECCYEIYKSMENFTDDKWLCAYCGIENSFENVTCIVCGHAKV